MNQKQLEKASKALQKKQRTLLEKDEELSKILKDLHQKKALLDKSRQRCDMQLGQVNSGFTFCNRNDFAIYLNQIAELVDQRIQEHQNKLVDLSSTLRKKKIMAHGVDYLLSKKIKNTIDIAERNQQLDYDELLDKR